MPTWYQTDLFESRELVEQHTQHHLVRLCWQICEEENLVRRRVVDVLSGATSCWESRTAWCSHLSFLAFHLSDHIGVCLAVGDLHWLIIKRESLHRSQRI